MEHNVNKKFLVIAAMAAMTSGLSNAHILEEGQTLPSVTVDSSGIATLMNGAVEYKEWSTDEFKNGVIIAQAARPVAAEMLPEGFADKVKASGEQGVVILNSDDAPFGAGMFISNVVEEGKIAAPKSQTVVDEDGVVAEEWELEEASSIVIAVQDGKVAFINEGELSPEQASKALSFIK